MSTSSSDGDQLVFLRIDDDARLPRWAMRPRLVSFLHETMKPWEDTVEDIQRSLDYVFSDAPGMGGFIVLLGRRATEREPDSAGRLLGAVVMLHTGMKGFVPETLLLFVSIDPDLRGRGLGRRLVQRALDESEGTVKLHVEYDNPAKRLYERIGFTTKYAEMRYDR